MNIAEIQIIKQENFEKREKVWLIDCLLDLGKTIRPEKKYTRICSTIQSKNITNKYMRFKLIVRLFLQKKNY